MRDMKHLRTFESFSMETINEEEILGIFKGKLSKVVDSFKSDNKKGFEKLSFLEKRKGKGLETIQKELMDKLIEFKKTLISDMKGDNPLIDNLNDINVVYKELSDTIKNVNPYEKGSTFQKIGRGSSGGFERSGS